VPEDPTSRWPRFKMVTFSQPTGIPNGWDAELLDKGAPDGLVVGAARELTLLEDPGSGPLVCFGFAGAHGRLCLDPRTKQVVHIEYGAFKPGNPQAEVVGRAHLVSSSLDQLIAMVRAATDRFPFDSDITVGEAYEDEDTREERRFNEWAQAVLELEETLHRIDPAVSTLGGEFWGDFLADVGMGNYSTEDILNPPDF